MYIRAYNQAMRRTTFRPPRPATTLPSAKTRITIRIDRDVLDWFRRQAGASGGYQQLVNRALRDSINREPLEATLRRVIREELARAGARKTPHGYDAEEPLEALVADSGAVEYGASLRRPRPPRRRQRNRNRHGPSSRSSGG
jgi:hypothetical protein